MDQPKQRTQTQPSQNAPSKKSSSNLALIIILIVVGFLIILGVGGYFGYKYWKNKTKTSASTTSQSNVGKKMQDLVNLFKYPGSTITESTITDQGADFTMETSDSLQKSYDYYSQILQLNGWNEGSNSYAPTDVGAWITISEKDFSNIIQFQKEDSGKTSISVSITTDNNLVTSTRKKPAAATTTTSSNSSKTAISTDYVIADSNSRVIATSELTSLTPWQLKVARNEIYARHGRSFVNQDLQCYFKTKSWYTVNPNYSDSFLTAIDNKNIATILAYEQLINSPLLQTDSGC